MSFISHQEEEEVSIMNRRHQSLHILAVPFPAQSHISAMMHLCKRLSLEQPPILITFANVDIIHEQMKRHWTGPPNVRLQPLPFAGWNIPNGFDAYCARHNGLFADSADRDLSLQLHHLVTRLNSSRSLPPVRCIISDYFLPWTQHVADQLQIPRVALWSGSASWACIEYHLPELTARGHIFTKDPEDCVIDYVEGVPPIERKDLPMYLRTHQDPLWRDHGLKRSRSLTGALRVFINSFVELETHAFEHMQRQLGAEKVLPLGPLFLLAEQASREQALNVVLRPEDEESLRWLDMQEPGSVLYISFGSIALFNRRQFEELAGALEGTRTPFLWVVRPEMVVGELSQETYVKVGHALAGLGRIISWAPQLQVLKHGSVGGFLTHCGWNSMLESMANGVPMLGWPWAGEQNTNCKMMVDEWKLGAQLGETVDREEIGRVIRLVMRDKGDQLKRRVDETKRLAVKAVREAEGHLKALLDELREKVK